ncbi:hypothetical protein CTI14_45180, partial [Methylobacterium radiotolerans]
MESFALQAIPQTAAKPIHVRSHLATSQGYLAHVASRAIILIEADNPTIGLVAVVPVGMIEVSSCVIGEQVVPGHHLEKGDELGYFQFGG